MTDSRSTALDLLHAVLRKRRPLDEALAANQGLAALEVRDRAFARMLVATTLRRLGQIDTAIDGRLAQPLATKYAAVRDILRLGVAQVAFLKVPPHAAVDTSVALTESRGHGAMKGLVNAVLRRIAESGAIAEDPGHANVPDWLWQGWAEAYGLETAARITGANLNEAPLDIRVKNPAEAARWAEALDATILPSGTLRRIAGGDVRELPGFAEGAWWVQDAAASLPASLLGEMAGQRVADLCAAPGGKTAQLAAGGASVTAVDISAKRLARLQENLARLGLSADTVAADATSWDPGTLFDGVLLDAPCSATGTLRRHPDIAWNKGPADIARMAALQRRLLGHSANVVKPGGLLIYATCSLQPEECEQCVDDVLAAGVPLTRVPIEPTEVPELAEAITAAGDLRTLPFHWSERGGLDGFFIARLRRIG